MALDDVYELTDHSELFDQAVDNVYFYRQNSIGVAEPDPATALGNEFISTVLPIVASMQTPDLVHREIRVRNLYNDAENVTILITVPGTWIGAAGTDAAPSFVACGFTLQGDNSAVDKGAKRIGGMEDDVQEDGVFTAISFLEEAAEAAAIFTETLFGGTLNEDQFVPTLVKRVRSGVPGNYSYRLPESAAEAVIASIIDAVFDVVVTSQISRKIGVGV